MDAESSTALTCAGVGGQQASPQADGHGGKALDLTLELPEGTHHDFVLVLAGGEADRAAPDPDWAWQGAEAAWRDRVPELERTVAPRDSRHSYAVLSGLTSAGGGMVAAATTSLPERARQGRNYDYRYVWIRDQCYAGQAVAQAGPLPLMDDAVRFVAERLLADGPQLKPAYTTTGEAVPDQRQLDLPGYPGGSDIVGNWVNQQFQLDAFGEALLLFAAAARHDHLDADGWRAAESAIGAIEQRWREPDTDAGIWEIDPDAWTHSRLICAAGLRADRSVGPGGEQAARWVSLADMLVSPTRRLTPSTPLGAGSARLATRGWMPPCCCQPSAARSRPVTPAPSRRSSRRAQSSPKTDTATAIAPTNGRSGSPKARFCSVAS